MIGFRRSTYGPATRSLFVAPRTSIIFPITSTSILVRRKQSSASFGSQTTGSFSLNEVFSTIGTPVRSRKALDQAVIAWIGLPVDGLQPPGAVDMGDGGMSGRFSSRI